MAKGARGREAERAGQTVKSRMWHARGRGGGGQKGGGGECGLPTADDMLITH